MRDFDRRGHGRDRGHGLGGHRMAKPLVIGVVLVAVLGLLVMSLWNALLPAVIGVKSIGFWQALGLLVLCRILFGGLGWRPGMFGRGRERHRMMHERWMQMSPEEREQFVQQRREGFWRHGFGHCRHGDPRERCGENERSRQKPEDNAPKPTEAE